MRSRPAGSEIEREGRALVEQLGGHWTLAGGLCRCPGHEDRTPSLSVRPGRTRLLLHCFAGCEARAVLDALHARGLLQPRAGAPAETSTLRPGDAGGSRAALRLWGAAGAVSGSPAQRYLAVRGIAGLSAELRFHSRTPLGPRPLTRYRPALIAAVRDETGLVAVHRTFLDGRGARLAALDQPRRALGALGGGAVRLGGTAALLGLAEGIETALSASALFGLPCWATLGTERFAHIALPGEVRALRLFLDNDPGGRRAEQLGREAWGHLPIEALYPPRAGDDWNDVLRRERRLQRP